MLEKQVQVHLQQAVLGIKVLQQGFLDIHLDAVLKWRSTEGSSDEALGQSLAAGIDASKDGSLV